MFDNSQTLRRRACVPVDRCSWQTSVRLSLDVDEAVDRLAMTSGVSRSEVIRILAEIGLSQLGAV